MYIGVEMITTSLPDVQLWVSPCELLYFSSNLETHWKKSGIRTEIEWFRPSHNRFPSVPLLHSNGRAGKELLLWNVQKGIFFFFRQTLCQSAKNINQYSCHGCRVLNASLSSLAFQSPGFRCNLHSAGTADCPPLSCLMDDVAVRVEDAPKAVLPEGFSTKSDGVVLGGLLPDDRTLNNLQLSGLDGCLWKLIFFVGRIKEISAKSTYCVFFAFGPFPLGGNHRSFPWGEQITI